MEDRIRKNVDLIIAYINNIRLENTSKNYINKIEFEFRDKYNTYKTFKFNNLLYDYCKNNNITYKIYELPIEGVARFTMELN